MSKDKRPPKRPKSKIKKQLEKAKSVEMCFSAPDRGEKVGKKPQNNSKNMSSNFQNDNELPKLTKEDWKIVRNCSSFDENDTDNGKRLLAWSGKEVVHVDEIGWHAWLGSHWDEESGNHAVSRAAQNLVSKIKCEAGLLAASKNEQDLIEKADGLRLEYPNVKDRNDSTREIISAASEVSKNLKSKRKSRYSFAVQTGNWNRTKALIAQAEPFQSVKPSLLDPEDYAINCKDGTLRFEKIENGICAFTDEAQYKVVQTFSSHNPDDMISKVTACNFNPKAKETIWRKDLKRFMPDEEKQEYLQVAMGYTALGLSGEQVFHFLYGDGQNWKSAFMESVGRTLGNYRRAMGFGSISGDQMPDGSKPSPDWAGLSSRRMVTIEEVPKIAPLKEEQIKVITSASPFPVRQLHKGFFDLMPKFVMWMASNSEPNIKGGDLGIWRRTRVVRFDEKVPDDEKMAFDKVMQLYEPCQEDILNWIVEGVHKYLLNGLDMYVTDDMRLYVNNLRRERDAVGAFAADCLVHSDGSSVRAMALYDAFKNWCQSNQVNPVLSLTLFGREIKRVSVGVKTMEKRKKKDADGLYYEDLMTKDVPLKYASEGQNNYDY